MKKWIELITVIMLLIPGAVVFSQTLEEAKKMYIDGNFVDSKPVFEKAIKSTPKNPSHNQWYGTCLLETGELEKAEPYLKFAASKDIQSAFRSLGKLYFLQYRFQESADAYQKYVNLLLKMKVKDEKEISSTKSLLATSERAARMLAHCEDVQIIDSTIVDKPGFLKYYRLSEDSGQMYYNDDSETTIVFENQIKDKRFYSKKNPEHFFRIYSQIKLMDEWVEEKALSIHKDNIPADENYPFVLSDGVTIYFASNNAESIGGYDLFITRYNINSESYFTPEQLGMPFNSIYNDYMMAIDELNDIGYFASDRFQPDGKVIIYTFIFNKEKKTIQFNDPIDLINYALIRSIRNSWKPNKDYVAFLQKVQSNLSNISSKKEKEFDFVINDNIVYHELHDFENDIAKNYFIQTQTMELQIKALEQNLEVKRQQYAKGSQTAKQALTASILADENQLDQLYEEFQQLKIKARSTEIKQLNQRNY